MILRRGEPVHNGEVLRSGDEAKRRALEDVRVCDECSGDDGSVGRISRSVICINADVFWACGGDLCVDSRGEEHKLGQVSSEDAIEGG